MLWKVFQEWKLCGVEILYIQRYNLPVNNGMGFRVHQHPSHASHHHYNKSFLVSKQDSFCTPGLGLRGGCYSFAVYCFTTRDTFLPRLTLALTLTPPSERVPVIAPSSLCYSPEDARLNCLPLHAEEPRQPWKGGSLSYSHARVGVSQTTECPPTYSNRMIPYSGDYPSILQDYWSPTVSLTLNELPD